VFYFVSTDYTCADYIFKKAHDVENT